MLEILAGERCRVPSSDACSCNTCEKIDMHIFDCEAIPLFLLYTQILNATFQKSTPPEIQSNRFRIPQVESPTTPMDPIDSKRFHKSMHRFPPLVVNSLGLSTPPPTPGPGGPRTPQQKATKSRHTFHKCFQLFSVMGGCSRFDAGGPRSLLLGLWGG
mgnify:CR=1 FL=1